MRRPLRPSSEPRRGHGPGGAGVEQEAPSSLRSTSRPPTSSIPSCATSSTSTRSEDAFRRSAPERVRDRTLGRSCPLRDRATAPPCPPTKSFGRLDDPRLRPRSVTARRTGAEVGRWHEPRGGEPEGRFGPRAVGAAHAVAPLVTRDLGPTGSPKSQPTRAGNPSVTAVAVPPPCRVPVSPRQCTRFGTERRCRYPSK